MVHSNAAMISLPHKSQLPGASNNWDTASQMPPYIATKWNVVDKKILVPEFK